MMAAADLSAPLHFGLPAYAIAQICQLLQACEGVERIILYGSRAKGNFRLGSDIDLALQAPGLDLSALLALENRIDDLLLPWSVDLALLHLIDNAALLDHIAQRGQDFCGCGI